MNPSSARIQLPIAEALVRFSEWMSLPELESPKELKGAKWAFRLTGVLSDLIKSAHLLSKIEFAQAARIWSEDAMFDPLWRRT